MGGEYYLHTNGKLIWKTFPIDDRDSTFIVKIWSGDEISVSPQTYLAFLVEAKALGALDTEIINLAERQNLSTYIEDWIEKIGL